MNWSKDLPVRISYDDITSDKALWTEVTLKCFQDKQWLTENALSYGLNRIIHQAQAREGSESLKRVVVLPVSYWRQFNLVDCASEIDSLTSRYLPKTLHFYDVIFVPAKIKQYHWMAYAFFPKLFEILELNSHSSISCLLYTSDAADD